MNIICLPYFHTVGNSYGSGLESLRESSVCPRSQEGCGVTSWESPRRSVSLGSCVRSPESTVFCLTGPGGGPGNDRNHLHPGMNCEQLWRMSPLWFSCVVVLQSLRSFSASTGGLF